jgi:hypothetical protein
MVLVQEKVAVQQQGMRVMGVEGVIYVLAHMLVLMAQEVAEVAEVLAAMLVQKAQEVVV